jgi:hypothetical protein
MLAYTQRSASGWEYWGAGLLASLSALVSAIWAKECSLQYPLCAVLTLCFFLGLLRSE